MLDVECVMTLSYWCHFSSLIFDESAELKSAQHHHQQQRKNENKTSIASLSISTLYANPCHFWVVGPVDDGFYTKRRVRLYLTLCVCVSAGHVGRVALIYLTKIADLSIEQCIHFPIFSLFSFSDITWLAGNDGDDDGRCSTYANRSLVWYWCVSII